LNGQAQNSPMSAKLDATELEQNQKETTGD
jgi:hypothetical protein